MATRGGRIAGATAAPRSHDARRQRLLAPGPTTTQNRLAATSAFGFNVRMLAQGLQMQGRWIGFVVASVAVVATVVGCKVSVPDVDSKAFRCRGPDDCASGYGCYHAPTQSAGELGWCTFGGMAVEACGNVFCAEGETCVKADAAGRTLECHKTCSSDTMCNPTGLCAVAHTVDDSLVGVCASCPTTCPGGRQCAKRRGAVDLASATYCNAPGQDCTSPNDTDGDQAAGCQDADCFAAPGCGQCGNFMLDSGEVCDGYVIAPGQSCPSGTTGTPRCTSSCTLDLRACTTGTTTQTCNNGVLDPNEECDRSTTGTTLFKNGSSDCSFWMSGTKGQVTCNANCTINKSSCSAPKCGDGSIDTGEQCDGSAFTGMSCAALSSELTGSNLACTPWCYFDPSSCTAATDLCGACIAAGGIYPNVAECTTSCGSSSWCLPWSTSPGLATAAAVDTPVSLAIDLSGALWAAWEISGGVVAAMYQNGSWVQNTPSVNVSGTSASRPAVAVDETNTPVVAYVALVTGGTPHQRLYVARWVAPAWMGIGGNASVTGDGVSGTAADAVGRPVLASRGGGDLRLAIALSNGTALVWKVSSTAVSPLPTPNAATGIAADVAIAVDPTNGDTLLGWLQGTQLYVSRLPSTGIWTDPSLVTSNAGSPGLAVDANGTVFAAWTVATGEVDLAQQKSDGSWMPVPGARSTTVAQGPSVTRMAIATPGPSVVWNEVGPVGVTRNNRLLTWGGEYTGWRGYAATECPGGGIDIGNTTTNDAAAVVAGGNLGQQVCVGYVAHPTTGAEVRVSCHQTW